MRPAPKDSKNPHFKSYYADFASVHGATLPALHANGIAVVQLPTITEHGKPALITRLIHECGESIESIYPIFCKDETDPQKLLSAYTYARRGALSAMLCVVAEDDDGNTAAGHRDSTAVVDVYSQIQANKTDWKPAATLFQSPEFNAKNTVHKNIMMTHIRALRDKNQIWSEDYTKTHGARAAAHFTMNAVKLNGLKDALISYAEGNK